MLKREEGEEGGKTVKRNRKREVKENRRGGEGGT
jgi:hypothetical protein